MSASALAKTATVLSLLGLLHCTSGNPEFPEGGMCQPGDRSCGPPRDRPIAIVCGRDSSDRIISIEEPCPLSSQCDAGRCLPGDGQPACQKQADCGSGQSCVPLVADAGAAQLGTFCVPSQPAPASVPPGGTCTRDSDCTTYRCLQGATRRYCFFACQNDTDCGLPVTCRPSNITISGIQGTVRACGS